MRTVLTLPEAILVALLGLFAIGSARAAEAAKPQEREQQYRAIADRAEARYRTTLFACEGMAGAERQACFREAKARVIQALGEAKARLRGDDPAGTAPIQTTRIMEKSR